MRRDTSRTMRPDTSRAGGRDSSRAAGRGLDLLVRAGLLGLGWWILIEGAWGGWPLALLVVGCALWVSVRLVPAIRWRLHPMGLIRFIPFFLTQSLAGGLDVARRAFHPRLPLAPGFIDFPLSLPPGSARLFFVGTVSLLPGTLSVRLLESGGSDPDSDSDPDPDTDSDVDADAGFNAGSRAGFEADAALDDMSRGRSRLRVHLLDRGAEAEKKLHDLEVRVADLFALNPHSAPQCRTSRG